MTTVPQELARYSRAQLLNALSLLNAPTDRVWVVTENGYEGTAIVGVYRTAELAKAAVEKVRTTPVEYMGGHMGRSHRIFDIDEHPNGCHDDDALDG